MKSIAAATTLILAASAFVIPGFGQKRTTEVEKVIASKQQARNKPVNLPRNKAPAPKKAAMTKPKKVHNKTSSPAQKKPAAAAKPAPAQKEPTAASDEDMEEKMIVGDDKMVDNDATMNEKTVEGDADKDDAQVEHEHVRRAGKPVPKKAAPKSKTAPKKMAAKPKSATQKKPSAASDEGMEEKMIDSDDKMVDGDAAMEEKTVEGDAAKDDAQVEHEHVRRAGKPKAAPKSKTAPKKMAAKPKSATKKPAAPAIKSTSSPSTEDDAEKTAAGDEKAVDGDEGMVMKDEKTNEKTGDSDEVAVENDADQDTDEVEHEHARRATKPAPKKSAPKPAPKKSAPKKAAPKSTKKPAAKPAAQQVNDDASLKSVSSVVQKASAKLRARDDAVAPTDVQILQYALTLEHLENAFYHGALEKFSQKAFVQGGLPSFARKRFEQIAEHEASHVAFLTSALGDQAVAPCEYTFPYTDPKSFAALSMVLEGVGVSAYLGAAEFIQNKEYLTAAGSILTTEARHASWIAGAVDKEAPWSGASDTPLSLDEVYSLAAGFITSCPPSNPALPVKAFPQLVVDTKTYKAGDTITLDFDETEANGEPTFLALFSGLNTTYAPIENKQATLPMNLEGTVYGVITTNGTTVNDENTIAGVAIFGFYENY